jgi:hypothetical protein
MRLSSSYGRRLGSAVNNKHLSTQPHAAAAAAVQMFSTAWAKLVWVQLAA